MIKRLFVILVSSLWLAIPLSAQSNKLIRELEGKRGALQKQIAETESILQNTKKDVGSQLNGLAALTGQIEERKRYILAINNDVETIERELVSLNRQLNSLEKDLKEKKKKYEASVQYLYKNKSIEEKLMFIFSAKNLGQTYRRMRYVQEYANFQRLQGMEIERKQKQIAAKKREVEQTKNAKQNLLKQGEVEKAKLELLTILKELVRTKKVAVLMSLHELDLAQKLSDYIICIKGDRIERCGTPEEVFTESYITKLYDITKGSYQAEFGCLEMEPVIGVPRVFVIGGGGSGIPVYRKLQRQGVPFAAGILSENDIDYPVARALASEVVSEAPFEPIREETFERAAAVLNSCRQVICCLETFGTLNEKNRKLAEMGKDKMLPGIKD